MNTATLRWCAVGMVLLVGAGSASAQMYKWVDEQGKVHFTDTPPPPGKAKAATELKAGGGASEGPALPYALAQAVGNHPVTLYTASNCGSCDQGRQLLQKRGVPFREKTVSSNEDVAKLKEAGSDSLPLLVVGSRRIVGFQPQDWASALDDAQYPASAMLPANYKNARAEPAAPIKPVTVERPSARDEALAPRPAPKTDGSAPPGFQF